MLGVRAQSLRHLDAELAGRSQHQCLRLVVVGVEMLKQRQAEGSGLPRAGLRLADHVAPTEQLGDRLLLDRRGIRVAELVEHRQKLLGQSEVAERGHGRLAGGPRRA